jgi:heat shock protein HslJ
MIRVMVLVLCLLVLVPLTYAQESDPLAGSQWELVTTGAGDALVDGSSITLAFGDDGRAVGSGGCNGYGGSYRINGDALSFSDLISTLRACAQGGVMAQETAYLAAIGAATTYTLEGDTLTIRYDGGALVFTRLATLADTAWLLQSYGADGETPVDADTSITLIIGSQNDIGGDGGCNVYGGSYSIEGADISISDVFSTLIACEEAVMTQEQTYFAALQAATSYTLDGDTLTINYGEGEQLVFTRRAELTDGVWQLEMLDSAVVVESAPTIEFRADGSVGGSSGCNNYRGMYTLEDDTLSLSPLASTRRACLDEAQNTQEAAFFAALGAISGYTLTADQLILTYGDGQQLVFMRGE